MHLSVLKAEIVLSMLSKAKSGVAVALTISPAMPLTWGGVGLLVPSNLVLPYTTPLGMALSSVGIDCSVDIVGVSMAVGSLPPLIFSLIVDTIV